ncbi:hypothetical protein [Engelhardtia mirabilis]|uniref:Uncharacterized protein n=1 Tax=Engelhardtia mirabilis TaxID=2528011 RepID=A0A518BNI3_9BACT|nr:hypothetical protein Pla133_36330 [Planctomycetes bacterium Pla133]QDV02860.1 hypothetical protein Pla86_36310 [Planctomycetes bacterium Pla86]
MQPSDPLPRYRALARWALPVAAARFAVLWWLWISADQRMVAFAPTSGVVSLLVLVELLFLTTTVSAIADAHRAMGLQERFSRHALGLLFAALALPLLVSAYWRSEIAELVGTSSTWLRTVHEPEPINPVWDPWAEEKLAQADWLVRWRRGEILAVELVFAFGLALNHVAWARAAGRTPVASALFAAIGGWVLALVTVAVFGLYEMTFDFIHHGILAAPLLVDWTTLPFPWGTEALVTTPFVLAFLLALRVIARRPVSGSGWSGPASSRS